jgi:hypothetical protein
MLTTARLDNQQVAWPIKSAYRPDGFGAFIALLNRIIG